MKKINISQVVFISQNLAETKPLTDDMISVKFVLFLTIICIYNAVVLGRKEWTDVGDAARKL